MTTPRVVVLKLLVDLLVRACGLAAFPVIAHSVGAAGYGSYAQVLGIVTLLVPLAGLGLASAAVAVFASERPSTDELVRIALTAAVSAVVIGTACVVLAPRLGPAVLNDARAPALLRCSGVLLVAGVLEMLSLEYLRARSVFGSYLVYQALAAVAGVASVSVVLTVTHSLITAVGALAAVRVALAVAVVGVALRHNRAESAEPRQGSRPVRTLVRLGLPLTIANLGVWMLNLGDRIVIGHYLPAVELGRYSAVYTLAGLTALVTGGLFLPAYTRIAQVAADRVELGRVLGLFHRYVALLLPPAAVLLVVLSPALLLLLGGSEFHVGTALVAVLVAGLVLDQWNGLAHYVLMASGRSWLLQNLWLSCGGLNVAVNIVVVPRFGLMGAAVVTLVSFLVLESAVFAAASRHAPLLGSYAWVGTLWSVAVAMAAGAVASWVPAPAGTPWLELLVRAFVFVTVCATGLLTARQVGSGDLQTIRSLVSRSGADLGAAEFENETR